MDEIQKILVKAGRKDLAQKYYQKVADVKKIAALSFSLNNDDLDKLDNVMLRSINKNLRGNNQEGYSWINIYDHNEKAQIFLETDGSLYYDAINALSFGNYKIQIKTKDDLFKAMENFMEEEDGWELD